MRRIRDSFWFGVACLTFTFAALVVLLAYVAFDQGDALEDRNLIGEER